MSVGTPFTVLGSGIIGASIAYHLARRGACVTLVDAATPAVAPAASWASAGGLRAQGRHGPEQAISRMAQTRWRTLSQELDADLEVRHGGHLHVAETEAEVPAVEARLAADRAAGLDIERVEGGRLRELAPVLAPHLLLGAWTPDDGQANPALVTRAFAGAAARQGARLLFHDAARPVLRHGRLELRSGDAALPSGRVVLATGAWSVAWLAAIDVALPLRWRGLQMLLSDPSPIRLSPTVTAVGRNLSLKQAPSGGLMIGGRWFASPSGPEPAVTPIAEHADRQWADAAAILPDLAHRHVQRSWAGAEAQTIDGLPFIGPVGADGLYLATGFSNHGFQTAPVIGALVADELLDGPQALLAPFRPQRVGHPTPDWQTFRDDPVVVDPEQVPTRPRKPKSERADAQF